MGQKQRASGCRFRSSSSEDAFAYADFFSTIAAVMLGLAVAAGTPTSVPASNAMRLESGAPDQREGAGLSDGEAIDVRMWFDRVEIEGASFRLEDPAWREALVSRAERATGEVYARVVVDPQMPAARLLQVWQEGFPLARVDLVPGEAVSDQGEGVSNERDGVGK